MVETDGEIATRPGHRLIVHSLLNATGQGLPIAVAIVAVPMLLRRLGTERFGLLTLAWSIVGYASLFDLGLGRALTQLVAERRHAAHDHELGELGDTIWSALVAMGLFGAVSGAIMFIAAPWLTTRLAISAPLQGDAQTAFRLLALGIPIVVLTAGMRGILEAYERFDLVNAVKAPMGLSTFLGPLVIALFSTRLAAAVVVLLVARVAGLLVQSVMVHRVLPRMRARFQPAALGPVVRFGAWMTVSNVLSPLMSSADRFFIGGMLSASVVAYYTAPYEMVTRVMSLVAVAVATSLFPAFARSWRSGDVQPLFRRGLRLTAVAFVPLMLLIIVFARPILTVWLGADLAVRSVRVLQILGVGVVLNGLAQVPFAHIQAIGRADLTAKIHIVEVPFYLAALIYLIRAHGIEGAAVAWTIRMAVDTAAMFVVSRRLLRTVAMQPMITETVGLDLHAPRGLPAGSGTGALGKQ